MELSPASTITISVMPDGALNVQMAGTVGPHHLWSAAHLLEVIGDQLLANAQAERVRQTAEIASVAQAIQRGAPLRAAR